MSYMPISVTYDEEVDRLYISSVQPPPVAVNVEVTEHIYVRVTPEGVAVGVEVESPCETLSAPAAVFTQPEFGDRLLCKYASSAVSQYSRSACPKGSAAH